MSDVFAAGMLQVDGVMNPVFEQVKTVWENMPKWRRVAVCAAVVALLGAFLAMFWFANKTPYGVLYSGLAEKDASAIVEKLKEMRVPYTLTGEGGTIEIPVAQVREVRLGLAGEGLPKGGGVGFEIFDKTDFGTTDFVQKLNLQRALQGELSRTIREFDEVTDARVMIVMPKDSVFVEETKPPSASVMLKLKRDLPDAKVDAVVNLVAAAIEDLTPERVTVVDTRGRVLFRGKTDAERAEEIENTRVKTQLKYKALMEEELTNRIESMLERVVGLDRAVVRVSTELDFSREDMSEEIFDPDERETPYVRSRKNSAESSERQSADANGISSVNPVVPPGTGENPNGLVERGNKTQDVVNYELSKRVRSKEKAFAVLTRLSVAAIIDGKYVWSTDENGNRVKRYEPRSEAEMAQFTEVVKNAMGYLEDRGDQVSVECFPFTADEPEDEEIQLTGLEKIRKDYGKLLGNALILFLLFLLVLRPIQKTVKEVKESAEAQRKALEEAEKGKLLDITDAEPEAEEMSIADQATEMAGSDPDRAANILRGWLREE